MELKIAELSSHVPTLKLFRPPRRFRAVILQYLGVNLWNKIYLGDAQHKYSERMCE